MYVRRVEQNGGLEFCFFGVQRRVCMCTVQAIVGSGGKVVGVAGAEDGLVVFWLILSEGYVVLTVAPTTPF